MSCPKGWTPLSQPLSDSGLPFNARCAPPNLANCANGTWNPATWSCDGQGDFTCPKGWSQSIGSPLGNKPVVKCVPPNYGICKSGFWSGHTWSC